MEVGTGWYGSIVPGGAPRNGGASVSAKGRMASTVMPPSSWMARTSLPPASPAQQPPSGFTSMAKGLESGSAAAGRSAAGLSTASKPERAGRKGSVEGKGVASRGGAGGEMDQK